MNIYDTTMRESNFLDFGFYDFKVVRFWRCSVGLKGFASF